MKLKEIIKSNAKVKELALWMVHPRRRPRPRRWIRWFVNPVFHKKDKGAHICRLARMDVFPFKEFHLGKDSIIEDFALVNNGAGDVIIGDRVRVGVGAVLIGPVHMGDGSGTGQHVFISGFNHEYRNGEKNSSVQPLEVKGVNIGEESHIGANSVVVAGVTIGKRCQIGAGSVVTKNIPDFSVAVGNPAKVIKRYNHGSKQWDRVIKQEGP